MTKQETAKLLAVIQVAYPSYHPGDMAAAINVWYMMLKAYDYVIIQKALKAYMAEDHEFAPSTGQVIARACGMLYPELDSGVEAWDKVARAVSNSTYNAVDEFAKLPPVVQKAVGSANQLHNWASVDPQTFETVIQSQFVRAYHVAAEHVERYQSMPQDVKQKIEEVNGRSIETVENGLEKAITAERGGE